MIEWLKLPDETRGRAFNEIAVKTGMSAFTIEKDWWVVQSLTSIFEMSVSSHLVFKGGTSLSKAWNLIERFSEDIDLAIDREFLGFAGELSKSKRTELRKASGKFIKGQFYDEFVERFTSKGIRNADIRIVESKDSDQDPIIIEIYYPYLIAPAHYLQPKIQIEIGCRSLREPYTVRSFGSLVDEHFNGQSIAMPYINVPTVNPERTFLEKIFLLHEEFHRPHEKMRVNRLSRHLYDIGKLAGTPYTETALTSPDLYSTIVEHRYKFSRIGGVDYNLLQPQTINFIPPPTVMKEWKQDYITMMDTMIYEQNPLSFEQLTEQLMELKNKINAIPWKVEKQF